MNRLTAAWNDAVTQVRLFQAECRHTAAVNAFTDAREEALRAAGHMVATEGELQQAQQDAELAKKQVKRYRERWAAGVR